MGEESGRTTEIVIRTLGLEFTLAQIEALDRRWRADESASTIALSVGLSDTAFMALRSRFRSEHPRMFPFRRVKDTATFRNSLGEAQRLYDEGYSLSEACRKSGAPYHLAWKQVDRHGQERRLGSMTGPEVRTFMAQPRANYSLLGKMAGVSKATASNYCRRVSIPSKFGA